MTDITTDTQRRAPTPRSARPESDLMPDRDPPGNQPADCDALVEKLVLALVRRGRELHRTDASGSQTLLDVRVGEVRCVLTQLPPAHDPCSPAQRLSPREREIVRLVAAGHTNKTIAVVLDISLYTVSTHLRRIFAKLGVSTRAAMIAAFSHDMES